MVSGGDASNTNQTENTTPLELLACNFHHTVMGFQPWRELFESVLTVKRVNRYMFNCVVLLGLCDNFFEDQYYENNYLKNAGPTFLQAIDNFPDKVDRPDKCVEPSEIDEHCDKLSKRYDEWEITSIFRDQFIETCHPAEVFSAETGILSLFEPADPYLSKMLLVRLLRKSFTVRSNRLFLEWAYEEVGYIHRVTHLLYTCFLNIVAPFGKTRLSDDATYILDSLLRETLTFFCNKSYRAFELSNASPLNVCIDPTLTSWPCKYFATLVEVFDIVYNTPNGAFDVGRVTLLQFLLQHARTLLESDDISYIIKLRLPLLLQQRSVKVPGRLGDLFKEIKSAFPKVKPDANTLGLDA